MRRLLLGVGAGFVPAGVPGVGSLVGTKEIDFAAYLFCAAGCGFRRGRGLLPARLRSARPSRRGTDVATRVHATYTRWRTTVLPAAWTSRV
jgi:hypothetical protein